METKNYPKKQFMNKKEDSVYRKLLNRFVFTMFGRQDSKT